MTSISRSSTSVSCTAEEARALTARIQQAVQHVHDLLLEAYERRAWAALGYASWREYAQNEFRLAQSHVYRLLDQARVIRAIEEAAGVSPAGEIVTEREARDLKPQLASVTTEIAERVSNGEAPMVVIKDTIQTARVNYLQSRKAADRPNRIIESIARDATYLSDHIAMVDFDALDGDCLPQWAHDIRQGAQALSRLAARLEQSCREHLVPVKAVTR